MKKINLIFVSLLALAINAMAQSTDNAVAKPTPAEGTIMYDKVQVPCQYIEVPVNEEVAKEAIKKKFKQMGYSGKERKDFMEFKNVSIPEIKNGSPVDAYVHVERKSKKEKESSIVSLITTDLGVVPGSAEHQASNAAAVAGVATVGAFGLLSSLQDQSTEHGLNLEMKQQEELVKKADKEYNNLVKDGDDLQGKLKKVQNEIEENRNNQVKQAEELKKQKEKLLQIQSRQKGGIGVKKD